VDTLKTLSVGVGGVSITWMDWIPWSIRVAVGCASLCYMFYKALNEKRKFEELKEVLPPFVVKMIVTKVMGVLVDQLKLDRISDYVFKDNNLDEQMKVLRDELDRVKVKLISIEKELK